MTKTPLANAGDIRDMDLIFGLGSSPGEMHDNPLQCSCLENFMYRGAWWATVLEPQSQTLLKQLNTHSRTFHLYMDLLKDILVASTFLQLLIKHSCEGF